MGNLDFKPEWFGQFKLYEINGKYCNKKYFGQSETDLAEIKYYGSKTAAVSKKY